MTDIGDINSIFDDLSNQANNAIEYLGNLDEQMDLLYETYRKISNARVQLEDMLIDDKAVNYIYEAGLESAVSVVMEMAPALLKESMIEALDSSEEFGRNPYRSKLLSIYDEPNLISIRPQNRKSYSYIDVELYMDHFAGNIELWGKAVKSVRDAHNWDQDPNKGGIASVMWRDRIFLRSGAVDKRRKDGGLRSAAGLWEQTIMERLSQSGAVAPFWSILNDGTPGSMSSDRGGVPYPSNAATHFVENAVLKIKDRFIIEFRPVKVDAENFVYTCKSRLRGLTDLMNDIDNKIVEIENDMVPIETRQNVATSYGLDTFYTESNKLLRAIYEYQQGEFVKTKITKEGRVEITIPGGARKRISIKKFKAVMAGVE